MKDGQREGQRYLHGRAVNSSTIAERSNSYSNEGDKDTNSKAGGSNGSKIAAVFIAAILILTIIGFVIAKNEEEQRSRNLITLITILQSSDPGSEGPPSTYNPPYGPYPTADSDSDGILDSIDPFPYEVLEPTSYQLKLLINSVGVTDYVDAGDDYAEVFFQAYIDDIYVGRIDNAGSPWSCKVGSEYWISSYIVHHIEQTHGIVNIKLVMMDEDFASDDVLDIDGLSSSSRTLNLTYDLDFGMIVNAGNYGQADGSLDGTSMIDDDDGLINYEITAWPEYGY